jgi:hypothetical protein
MLDSIPSLDIRQTDFLRRQSGIAKQIVSNGDVFTEAISLGRLVSVADL